MSVTQKEIDAVLRGWKSDGLAYTGAEMVALADRIEREGIAAPDGYAIVPIAVLDLTRFMCATWNEIDKWAYTVGGEAIMTYPVIQGSSNQISLRKIGEQTIENKNIPVAVKWMLTAAKESL
jgi:hypothetical protein